MKKDPLQSHNNVKGKDTYKKRCDFLSHLFTFKNLVRYARKYCVHTITGLNNMQPRVSNFRLFGKLKVNMQFIAKKKYSL